MAIGSIMLLLMAVLCVLVIVLLVRRPMAGISTLALIGLGAAAIALATRARFTPLPPVTSQTSVSASATSGSDTFRSTDEFTGNHEWEGFDITCKTPQIQNNQLVLPLEIPAIHGLVAGMDEVAREDAVRRAAENVLRTYLSRSPDGGGSSFVNELRRRFQALPEAEARDITSWLIRTSIRTTHVSRAATASDGNAGAATPRKHISVNIPIATLNTNVNDRYQGQRRHTMATSLLAVGIVVVAYLILRGSTKHARRTMPEPAPRSH